MPFPLMAVASALAAGGSLVPHAAGGMIVTGAGGYVAGTYLSTTAIAGLLGGATATVSGTALAVVGAVKSGVLGGGAAASAAAAGATGANGALMSVGMLSAAKIAAPLLVGGAVLIAGYYGYRVLKLTGKANAAPGGQEARFTESEARLVEGLIKRLPRDK